MTPELQRKLDRLVLMERLAKLRDAGVVIGLLAVFFVGALFLRSHPTAHKRLALFVALVEAAAVLLAIALTLTGYRKLAVSLLFGDRKPGENDETQRWYRRRRPPSIAQIDSTPVGGRVDWRLETLQGKKGDNGDIPRLDYFKSNLVQHFSAECVRIKSYNWPIMSP